MRRSVRLPGIFVAAVGLFAMGQLGCEREPTPQPTTTPLFEQRLREMHDQFAGKPQGPAQEKVMLPAQPSPEQLAFVFPSGLVSACAGSACISSACAASACAGSGCSASACGGSGCVASACAGSACVGSGCGGSGCVGSGCGGSGCAGSACGASGCGGSACIGTGCAGSACAAPCASKRDSTHDSPYAGSVVAASCPFDSSSGEGEPVRIAGFNMSPVESGLEVSWITTGGEVESFKVYRVNTDGTEEVVAQGPATSNRLMRVAIPAAGRPAAPGVHVVAITSRTGWETRVSSDGKTERRPPLLSSALARVSP